MNHEAPTIEEGALHGASWMDEAGPSRLAGTWPFNLVALGCVLAISAFVVFAPVASDAGGGAPIAPTGEQFGAGVIAGPRALQFVGPPTPIAVAPTTSPPTTTTTVPATTTTTSTSTTTTSTSTTTTSAPTTTTAPPPRIVYVPVRVTDPPAADQTVDTTVAPPTTIAASTTTTVAPLPQCWNYATWPAAQAAFEADPIALLHLDGDGDGTACEDLPGVPPPVPDVADVIAPTVRYFGVHTREAPSWMGEVDELASAVAKTPSMVMFFSNLTEAYPHDDVERLWNRGMLPMITLEPIVPGSTTGQPELDDLADGTWDAYFTEWATAACDQGKPVVLRFAHEMNGNWYSWSERFPGNEPGDYVAAWRHIHDIFTSVGADNVVWMWNVNRVNSLPGTISSYYPGSAYVDWVGASAYHRPGSSGAAPNFGATFSATLTQLRAAAPGKPIVFGETGTAGTEADRVAWTNDLFAGLLANPDIYGFVWFNDIKNGNDWRIGYSTAVTAAVAAGIADPRDGAGVPAM